MFASKTRLIATGAAGVLALGAATQSAAQAPAKQDRAAPKAAAHVKLSRRSGAVARYESAYRKAQAAGAVPTKELAAVQGQSTAELHQAAARLAAHGSNGASAADAGAIASPESYGVSQSTLDAIAACESGGDPTAVSADGTYRGKYQFDYGTWASMGGSGDPAAAPEAEQDMRAAMLYAQAGSSPWPICG